MSTKILVFDTETNGLWSKDANKPFPFIVQLSYIVFDINTKTVVKTYNKYIKQKQEMDYTSEAFQITGITREMCDNGISIVDALIEFYMDYMSVGKVVAHNIEFDRRMLEIEMLRNHTEIEDAMSESPHIPPTATLFREVYNQISNIVLCCTMNLGKHVCNIMKESNFGGKYKKPPKLIELYEKLFEETPKNLHNSLIDCALCLRSYVKMTFKYTIPKSQLPCLSE